MKQILLFAVFIITLVSTSAQSTFNKRYYIFDNLVASDFIVHSDSEIVLVGGCNGTQVFFNRFNGFGEILSSKKYVNTGQTIKLNKVLAVSDSTFMSVGSFFNNESLVTEGLCMLLNENGDTLWTRRIHSGMNETCEVTNLKQLSDSTVILTGFAYNNGFALKMDVFGNEIWGVVLGQNDVTASQGGMVNFQSVEEDDAGNLILVGYKIGANSNQVGLIVGLDAAGNLTWSKSTAENGLFSDILKLGQSYFLLEENSDYILKLDQAMQFQWGKRYFSSYSDDPSITFSLEIGKDSTILVSGNDSFLGSVLRIDGNGTPLESNNVFGKTSRVKETDSLGLFFLSNGPIYGVKSQTITQQHFSLSRISSLDISGQDICNWPISFNAVDGVYNFQSDSILITNSIQLAENHLTIDTLLVQSEIGCVDFLGGLDEENGNNNFLITPNPSSSEILISMLDASNEEVLIFDSFGRLLKRRNLLNGKLTMSIAEYENGIYWISILGKTQKIVKN
jgi:hypothetical protein